MMDIRRNALLLGGLFLLGALPGARPGAFAESSVYEIEPNDTPAEATVIRGAVTLFGAMSGRDQDGYLWTVSDEDARKLWTLELIGIPGRLTQVEVIRLHPTEDGTAIARSERLMGLSTPQGRRPALARDLLFEPGEYLIGISHAGGATSQGGGFRPSAAAATFGQAAAARPEASPGATSRAPGSEDDADADADAYRLFIREGRRLGVREDPEPHERSDPRPLKPGDEHAHYESDPATWYALAFDDPDGVERWDLEVQVPVGRVVEAELLDADGRRLLSERSDDRGLVRFVDIAPGAGTLHLGVTAKAPGFLLAARSLGAGSRIEGSEREPNDTWAQANRIDWTGAVSGRAGRRHEEDHFRFIVDQAMATRTHRLTVSTENAGEQMDVCLLDADGGTAQCRRGRTPIDLPGLVFSSGAWGLRVSRAEEGTAYSLRLVDAGEAEADREAEPNDTVDLASGVPARLRIKGRLAGDDEDHFRFILSDVPQLWRFQVIGDGVRELSHFDGAGSETVKRSFRSGRRARLENLYLLPGTHTIRVAGSDGDYTLLARPLGPPDPDGEREPNDDPSRTQRLAMGQTRTGLLADADDTDRYRFFLANHDHIRLAVQPPADGDVQAVLTWYDQEMAKTARAEPGQPAVLAGVFPPGDYQLALSSLRAPSDAEYAVSLERLPRFGCPGDCEPNGFRMFHAAAPLPPGGRLVGNSGVWGDEDTFALPAMNAPGELVIGSATEVRLALSVAGGDPQAIDYDDTDRVYRTTLPAGEGHQLVVDSREADYDLTLTLNGAPFPPTAPEFPVSIALELDAAAVSAYRTPGQQVGGTVRVSNTGDGPQRLVLDAVTSDYRWTARLEETALELAAGGSREIPLEVQVPADAWADRPVRVSVRAHDWGAQNEAWQEIAVERDPPAVAPVRSWSVPEALRGGFNVAGSRLGGRAHGSSSKVTRFETLFDGLTFDNNRVMSCCAESSGWGADRPTLTVDLAGEAPVPVAGIALNHMARANPYMRLRSGALLLSEDDVEYREVLRFETSPVRTEQYYVLPEPVLARFARLRIDGTFHRVSGAGGVILGEWKVITTPGVDVSGGAGLNLADPELGGHVVFTDPPAPQRDTRTLDADVPSFTMNFIGAGDRFDYVIGFHHDRAAKIREVAWPYPDDVPPERRFERIDVAVSTESTAGPWHAIGRLDTMDGNDTLILDQPAWARFVRFSTQRPADGRVPMAPQSIRIVEVPTDDAYRSILGEWGYASRAAIFEAGQKPSPEASFVDGNGSRAQAAQLVPGDSVRGQVSLGRGADWYRLDVPAEQNVLRLVVAGEPSVRVQAMLENAAGERIPLRRLPRQSSIQEHAYEAIVAPGQPIWVRVEEPPRNIVISWDTSASVVGDLPTIYESLAAFSNEVIAGRERVNLLPFGRSLLLDRWHGEAYVLQTVLNDYPRRRSSSAAERALKTATEALAPLPGSKSVLLITDGRTSYDGRMWSPLNRVAPQVFGVGVGGLEAWNVDVFQDWSSAGGGHYSHLAYDGEMEVAFDRAVTMMRRPADYTLTASVDWRETPGPGRLVVLPAEGATQSQPAVALVLDASGSMLQRLGGERRIDIARGVLTDAVTNVIPPGTPLALRVFGHKEPDACRTDLEIPLGPLEPREAASVIGGIRAMNLARTPIAGSLAAVRDDLGAAERALIVLVTDGEETCDGDPGSVIETLRSAGLGVNLNIVGFAIDNAELARQFESWARQGGGRYFSAADRSGLDGAIRDALKVPYEVLDVDGSPVAQGVVGGAALALDQGIYSVAIGGADEIISDVEIVGGEELTLRLER